MIECRGLCNPYPQLEIVIVIAIAVLICKIVWDNTGDLWQHSEKS